MWIIKLNFFKILFIKIKLNHKKDNYNPTINYFNLIKEKYTSYSYQDKICNLLYSAKIYIREKDYSFKLTWESTHVTSSQHMLYIWKKLTFVFLML